MPSVRTGQPSPQRQQQPLQPMMGGGRPILNAGQNRPVMRQGGGRQQTPSHRLSPVARDRGLAAKFRNAVQNEVTEQRAVHQMREFAGIERSESERKGKDLLFRMFEFDHPVSRETQLSCDLTLLLFGFSGSTSLLTCLYHVFEKDWVLSAVSGGWGLVSLAICLAVLRNLDSAETILIWSCVAQIIECGVSIQVGLAPEGYIAEALLAMVVCCLIHPTKGTIIVMHLMMLIAVLNYYLGKNTDTMMDPVESADKGANMTWRAGYSIWSILLLAYLMINVLKPIRRRIAARMEAEALRKKLNQDGAAPPGVKGGESTKVQDDEKPVLN